MVTLSECQKSPTSLRLLSYSSRRTGHSSCDSYRILLTRTAERVEGQSDDADNEIDAGNLLDGGDQSGGFGLDLVADSARTGSRSQPFDGDVIESGRRLFHRVQVPLHFRTIDRFGDIGTASWRYGAAIFALGNFGVCNQSCGKYYVCVGGVSNVRVTTP